MPISAAIGIGGSSGNLAGFFVTSLGLDMAYDEERYKADDWSQLHCSGQVDPGSVITNSIRWGFSNVLANR